MDRDISKELAIASDSYSGTRNFTSIDANIGIRSEFSNSDYEYYRGNNRLPKDKQSKIKMSMDAYNRVPIVRNIIDLMSDFGVQGISFKHEIPSVERLINSWFNYVGGYFTSERFLNMLYRTANVPIYRQTGKITVKTLSKWKSKNQVVAKEFEEPKVQKKEIPVSYSILNPTTIETVGGNLASLVKDPQYLLKVPSLIETSASLIFKANDLQNIIEQLPDDIGKAFKERQPYMLLDKNKFNMYFYKKDDWDTFAEPMLAPLIEPLITLEKMHLADRAALDGAISQIRLWKLGVIDTANPQNSIIPTKAAIDKLIGILSNNTGGGPIDLAWGPDIDFKESDTKVHQFLGPTKYIQVMSEIYGGLGVPPSLTGDTASGGGGFTNNAISMNTLIERLKYGRKVLESFWINEVKRLQKALGFSKMPAIVFDYMNLGDQTAFFTLLLGMVDRNIITDEELRRRVDIPEDIEKIKLSKESEARKEGLLAPKAGPYHNANTEDDMKKLLMQHGSVAPSELGVNLKPRKDGEEPIAKTVESFKPKPSPSGSKPIGMNGRPKNKKDNSKRKTRTPKPMGSGFLNTYMFAQSCQEQIQNILIPGIKTMFGVDNMRQMSSANKEEYEKLKILILANMNSFEEVNEEKVYNILSNDKSKAVLSKFLTISQNLASDFYNENNRHPNTDETKTIYSYAYALYQEQE